MSDYTGKLNFSQKQENETAIKLHSNRDIGYYYDNLCLYCANNDINPNNTDELWAAAEIMEAHGSKDMSTDHYFFWIDNNKEN